MMYFAGEQMKKNPQNLNIWKRGNSVSSKIRKSVYLIYSIWSVVKMGALSNIAKNSPSEHMETGVTKIPQITHLTC